MRLTLSPIRFVTQMRFCGSIAIAKGRRSLQGFFNGSLDLFWQKNWVLEGSPLGKRTSSMLPVSTVQMSPFGAAIIPCIVPSLPPKFQPSGGESGLPVLSNSETVLPVQLVTHTFSWASSVNPNPGPPRPPPRNPSGAGESALPSGANSVRPPVQAVSWFCAPTMKLSATQAFPWLSIISLPGPFNPPPSNFSGNTQALGEKVR